MPPRMITGSSSAQPASRKVVHTRRSWNACSTGKPLRSASAYDTAISRMPPTTPGMTPATNSSTMELSDITP